MIKHGWHLYRPIWHDTHICLFCAIRMSWNSSWLLICVNDGYPKQIIYSSSAQSYNTVTINTLMKWNMFCDIIPVIMLLGLMTRVCIHILFEISIVRNPSVTKAPSKFTIRCKHSDLILHTISNNVGPWDRV